MSLSEEQLSASEQHQIFEWVRHQPRGARLAMRGGITATVESRDAVGYIRVCASRDAMIIVHMLYKTTDFN